MRAAIALTLMFSLGACGEPASDGIEHGARCLGIPESELASQLEGIEPETLLAYDCAALRAGLLEGKADLGPALAELARKVRALFDPRYRDHVCAQAQSYAQECMAGGGDWHLVACDAEQEKAARFVLEQRVCPWHSGLDADPVELRVAMVRIGFWMLDLPPAVDAAQKKKAEKDQAAKGQ